MKKKIIIIDDHAILREGLRLVLNRNNNFEVVADFDNERSLNEFLIENQVDIVLMDINLTGSNGIDIAHRTKQQFPDVKIIIHSLSSDGYNIERSKLSGADGYVIKCGGYKNLESAINQISVGQTYFPNVA